MLLRQYGKAQCGREALPKIVLRSFCQEEFRATVKSHTMQLLDVSASLAPSLRVSALLQCNAIL